MSRRDVKTPLFLITLKLTMNRMRKLRKSRGGLKMTMISLLVMMN